jgi:ribosomal protein S18 acetylase RimI-like enzyme
MTMNLHEPYIRLASAEDAILIADLSRQTFYESFHAFNTKENMDKFMNEQFNREKLIGEFYDPKNSFLLACHEDRILGYTKLRVSDEESDSPGPGAMEIVRIYAVRDSIGKGIGSFLMKEAIELARQKKFSVIWLGVWEHNHRAIAFYEKWGFKRYGQHIFMLGDDPQTDLLLSMNL